MTMTEQRISPHIGQPLDPEAEARNQYLAAADLRQQIAVRLRELSARHADQAWTRRHSDPIAPHALALLFAEPSTGLLCRLKLATRAFLDGTDVADPRRLLFDLNEIMTRADAGQDPREHFADRTEPMTPSAFYIGLALSTLDTPRGLWVDVRERATGPLTIPGRCIALLTDGTQLLVDRGEHREFDNFRIFSTHTLDVRTGNPVQPWAWMRSITDLLDPAYQQTCQRLYDLHMAIWQLFHGR